MHLYGFLENHSISRYDFLGLEIVAPPDDFLKDGDCLKPPLTVDEFIELQEKWGARLTGTEKRRLEQGCIGICKVAIGDGMSDRGLPEDYPKNDDNEEDTIRCWAGQSGREKADEWARDNCEDDQTPVIWSKRGRWAPGVKQAGNGERVDRHSVIGLDPTGRHTFDYVTRLGDYELDMERAPSNERDKVVNICRRPILRGNYPVEIWCVSCCTKDDNKGYNRGYEK